MAADQSSKYADAHDYYIRFQHIPSGLGSAFKAFITEFEDQYTCNWNDVDVYGRMDPISTYQGTKRKISLSFDVVAYDAEEALMNLENSRRLIQSLYPVYDEVNATAAPGEFSATSIQAPPIMRMSFVNLVGGSTNDQSLVGKLDGISYKPDFDAGVFDGAGALLPKINRFSCNFTVLHTEQLGFNDLGRWRGNGGFPYGQTTTGFEGRPDVIPAAAVEESIEQRFTAANEVAVTTVDTAVNDAVTAAAAVNTTSPTPRATQPVVPAAPAAADTAGTWSGMGATPGGFGGRGGPPQGP